MCFIYRQQTLRTSEMSLIFNKFQFIYIYMNDASISSLLLLSLSRFLSRSYLLANHMKFVYMSYRSIHPSFIGSFSSTSPSSSSCEKDEKNKSWVIIWTQWMNDRKWNVHKNRFNRIDDSIDIRPFREKNRRRVQFIQSSNVSFMLAESMTMLFMSIDPYD